MGRRIHSQQRGVPKSVRIRLSGCSDSDDSEEAVDVAEVEAVELELLVVLVVGNGEELAPPSPLRLF